MTLHTTAQAQYSYRTNNGTITLTKYTGRRDAVTIPSTINGLPVTSIGNSAFDTEIRPGPLKLLLEKHIFARGGVHFDTNIRMRLTRVTIPNSVTSIGDGAFNGCYRLTSITIPNSVTNIGNSAFHSCNSLVNVTIGSGVASIGNSAFHSCHSLTNLTLGNSVISIGNDAFRHCRLTRVTIPDNVTNIGDAAFAGCYGLKAINVHALNPAYSSVDGVLFNKSQTTLVQYPYPFGKAGSYTIPSSVTNVGNSAFSGCKLTSVTIPDSVTSVGNHAFADCGSLTNITIGSRITRIGDEAFSDCRGLANVIIPNSVTDIGKDAFSDCTKLTAVYFRGNAPSLRSPGVFSGDYHATVYYLPGISGWGATFGGRPTALWKR